MSSNHHPKEEGHQADACTHYQIAPRTYTSVVLDKATNPNKVFVADSNAIGEEYLDYAGVYDGRKTGAEPVHEDIAKSVVALLNQLSDNPQYQYKRIETPSRIKYEITNPEKTPEELFGRVATALQAMENHFLEEQKVAEKGKWQDRVADQTAQQLTAAHQTLEELCKQQGVTLNDDQKDAFARGMLAFHRNQSQQKS